MGAPPGDSLRLPLALPILRYNILKRPVDQLQRVKVTADPLDRSECTGLCRVFPRDVPPGLHFPAI
jgi:hypothetical protein